MGTSEIIKTKGILKLKSGKHLYYWGLIGLIPNFGLIAGVILAYKGIFKYKDKKLFFIGCGGILFTILFWVMFKYSVNNNKWFSEKKIELSQKGLDQVVKEVEFYKVKNGIYPESLQHMGHNGTSIIYNDPFLPTDSNNTFTYKKTLDGYILFSVGIDGLPFTNDDIYPPITLTK